MRNGFTFKGKHSSEFPYIIVKTKDKSIFPSPKISEYEADNRSGNYDFTDYTGITFYKNRTIQLEIAVLGENLLDLQNKLSYLMRWLSGKGALVFDETSAVQFIGRVNDSISYVPERGGKHAVLAVTFQCEPFSKSLWDEWDGPMLDSAVPLDSDIMLDPSVYLTVNEGTSIMTFYGDAPIEPVIYIQSGARTIVVENSLGVKSITVNYSGEYVVDCEKKQVYHRVSENTIESLMNDTTGNFLTLMPDDNKITVSGGNVELHYYSQWYYNRIFN